MSNKRKAEEPPPEEDAILQSIRETVSQLVASRQMLDRVAVNVSESIQILDRLSAPLMQAHTNATEVTKLALESNILVCASDLVAGCVLVLTHSPTQACSRNEVPSLVGRLGASDRGGCSCQSTSQAPVQGILSGSVAQGVELAPVLAANPLQSAAGAAPGASTGGAAQAAPAASAMQSQAVQDLQLLRTMHAEVAAGSRRLTNPALGQVGEAARVLLSQQLALHPLLQVADGVATAFNSRFSHLSPQALAVATPALPRLMPTGPATGQQLSLPPPEAPGVRQLASVPGAVPSQSASAVKHEQAAPAASQGDAKSSAEAPRQDRDS